MCPDFILINGEYNHFQYQKTHLLQEIQYCTHYESNESIFEVMSLANSTTSLYG